MNGEYFRGLDQKQKDECLNAIRVFADSHGPVFAIVERGDIDANPLFNASSWVCVYGDVICTDDPQQILLMRWDDMAKRGYTHDEILGIILSEMVDHGLITSVVAEQAFLNKSNVAPHRN